MPRGRNLSESEQNKLLAYTTKNISMREMARRIGRSDSVVRNFLKKMSKYGIKKPGGPKYKMSDHVKHCVITHALNTRKTAAQIAKDCGVNVSRWTVARLLRQNKLTKNKPNVRNVPKLLLKHKTERLEFAIFNKSTDWKTIIFSDIKKFNLDGPDGYQMYWRDLREDQCYFSENKDAESLYVWAAFCANGCFQLAFTSNYKDPVDYALILQRNLLPFLRKDKTCPWLFQCSNTAVHNNRHYEKWIESQKIRVLKLPEHSSDINPIESLWAYVVFDVYTEVKQYNSVTDLKNAIIKSWNSVATSTIADLLDKMSERITEIIENNGEYTIF